MMDQIDQNLSNTIVHRNKKDTHLVQFLFSKPCAKPSPNQRRLWYNPTLYMMGSGDRHVESRGKMHREQGEMMHKAPYMIL